MKCIMLIMAGETGRTLGSCCGLWCAEFIKGKPMAAEHFWDLHTLNKITEVL